MSGPEHRDTAAQCRPHGDRVRPCRTGPQCRDERQRRRIGHAGGQAADDPCPEEHRVAGREAGDERGRDGDEHPQHDHALAAVPVAQRPEPEDRRGEAERVAHGDQIERRLGRIERRADRRQGDVGHRQIQVRDRGDQDRASQGPASRSAVRRPRSSRAVYRSWSHLSCVDRRTPIRRTRCWARASSRRRSDAASTGSGEKLAGSGDTRLARWSQSLPTPPRPGTCRHPVDACVESARNITRPGGCSRGTGGRSLRKRVTNARRTLHTELPRRGRRRLDRRLTLTRHDAPSPASPGARA